MKFTVGAIIQLKAKYKNDEEHQIFIGKTFEVIDNENENQETLLNRILIKDTNTGKEYWTITKLFEEI